MDDLVKREGIYYQKFTDVPFTRKVTGKEKESFKILDSKRHLTMDLWTILACPFKC